MNITQSRELSQIVRVIGLTLNSNKELVKQVETHHDKGTEREKRPHGRLSERRVRFGD